MELNGDLPDGWSERRIDEIAEVRFSSVDKNSVEGEIPVRLCNYVDVWKNQYIHTKLDFMIATATKNEVERFGLQPGDVLLTKDSETREEIAEPSVVHEVVDNLVLGYHLALVRPNARYAVGLFLAAQLRLPSFRSQFIRAASGITRYGLGLETVKSAKVWLPSTETQHHIARVLRSIEDVIEASREVIRQVRGVKLALLDQLILRGLPQRENSLTTYRLGELFTERKERGQAGLPTFSVTMVDGLVDRDSLGRRVVSELTPDQHLLVRKGDIAYNMMRMWQGVFGLAPYDGIVSPAYVVLKPRPPIDSHFASYLFRHPATIRKFERYSQGLTGDRLRLYFDQFAKIPVDIPDVDTQRTIAESLQAVDDRIRAEEEYLGGLTEFKAALSHELLTGKVPVPSSREE